MTLINIIRKYLFYSILVVLVIGCISHYFIFRFFIHYSTDHILVEQQEDIEKYIAKNDTLILASTLVLEPARIEQKQISPEEYSHTPKEIFKDSTIYIDASNTFVHYRQLYFTTTYKNKYYLININAPTVIPNDLLYAVITSLLVLVILFILFTYIIEFLLKKNIWKPLTLNLKELNSYNLKANAIPELKNPGIQEFDEINDVILRMVKKINEDYENSRIFIEDASHEMQTPLSIIKSKLELLYQKKISENDVDEQESLQAMSRAVSRLSRLNKSLLLINKINNNQYDDKKQVEFDKLLLTLLADLEELFEAKGLRVNKEIHPTSLYIDPVLAEMLLSNLLSNVLKYSTINGEIDITLKNKQLIISNDSEKLDTITDNLFNRMTQHKRSTESSGLGLNIVKSICDKNSFTANYAYTKDKKFSINIVF